MSELQPKYFIIQKLISSQEDRQTFNEMLNQAFESGHRVHTFSAQYEESEYKGVGYTRYTALMSLSSPSKYEDISNLQDVVPNDVDEYLANGWIVADSWSKFIRMVRPLKQKVNVDG